MDIDKKILEFKEILKASGKIRFDVEFCEIAGVLHPNLVKIKKGKSHFRLEHIENLIDEFRLNPNWLFGLSDKMYLSLDEYRAYKNGVNNAVNMD